MQDLYNKLEELNKALAMKSKSQQNTLVPALSVPAPKPLSIPSTTSSSPTKLPGVAPTSGKDPVKMAQQLKNPRPKAPKMEILKFDMNGQWQLHDAEMEKRSWSDKEAKAIRLHEVEVANKKVQHTNTGQRGVKAYTSSVHGTAEEQASRLSGINSPVKHFKAGSPEVAAANAKLKV